ncbi:MAG: deoxyhypusine synthase family protein [Terracidiphilus sp.]
MFVTIAGAMSTAELGLSLAEMIRQDKIHGICCTGANLEEDVFNLVAHNFYERVPGYRDLTPADEAALLARHMNRVTDTCIPEMEAMRRIENEVLAEWVKADKAGGTVVSAPVHVQDSALGSAREELPDRPER